MLLRNEFFTPHYSKNYIRSDEGYFGTAGWSTYADAAGTTPVDGTGGSPSITFSTNRTNPLSSVKDFVISKDAANRQGQGISYDFKIDRADKTKILTLTCDFDAKDANYVSGDIAVFLYDVTNSLLYTVSSNSIDKLQGQLYTTFNLDGNSSSYRLIFHITSTNSATYSVYLNNITLRVADPIAVPAMSDWIAYTPTIGGLGTVSNRTVYYRRIGDSVHISGSLTCGTVSGSVVPSITLPNGLNLDTAKISGTFKHSFGHAWRLNSGAATGIDANQLRACVYSATLGGQAVQIVGSAGAGSFISAVGTAVFTNSDSIAFDFRVPIAGWSSNVISSISRVFKISSYLANGSRITGSAPSVLGQYRSYLRGASGVTYSETNGSPGITPTVTNGIRLYGGNGWASADTNNEPSRYDIFVGKNKYIQWEFYSTTGRTGNASIDRVLVSTTAIGCINSYDPITGIASITQMASSVATSAGACGQDPALGSLTDIYFDIAISDNPVPVQQDLSNVYPVGCIYTEVTGVNPSITFGFGTWTAFGSGRCLVGVDTGQTEFDTVEETGGSKTHTLTVSEMPAHTHSGNYRFIDGAGGAGSNAARGRTDGTLGTATVPSEGGGSAHNNLQPYITVYFWKRTV